jgi:hypothetical protein
VVSAGVFAVLAPPAAGHRAPAPAPPGSSADEGAAYLKPGLWRRTLDGGGPNASTELCVDEQSDSKITILLPQISGANCTNWKFNIYNTGSSEITFQCRIGQVGSMTLIGAYRGDFNSRYTETFDLKTSGGVEADARGERRMTGVATWVGDCAPGQKGGDVVFPNGSKMNLFEDDGMGGSAG